MTFVYALKVALSKRHLVRRASVPFWIQGKMNVSRHFLHYSTLLLFRILPYAIITIKHAFLIHLHLPGPSGDVETLAFQARFSTSPSGPADVK